MMLSRLKRDLTMAEAARAPGGARVDLLLVGLDVLLRRRQLLLQRPQLPGVDAA